MSDFAGQRPTIAVIDNGICNLRSVTKALEAVGARPVVVQVPRDVTAAGEAGPAVAKAAYDFLYAHKVLVRYFPSHALTASFLRISVGSDEEMLVLEETLQAWLKNA